MRKGFTIVELLVAMALTLFIMVILSQCFIQGLETFSSLKAIGDMQEKLRTATNILRDDLAQDHFEGKRRLSDPDIVTLRPREGFVKIYQGTASVLDGVDADGIPSYSAVDHVLNFSCKQRGNRRENVYAALSRPGLLGVRTNFFDQPSDSVFRDTSAPIYTSPWCEVGYFLVKTGTTIEPNNPAGLGTPIYALYRSQFVVVPDNTKILDTLSEAVVDGSGNAYGGYEGICCISTPPPGDTTKLYFSTPSDLTVPSLRTFGNRGIFPDSRGANLVLTDVLSFQVHVLGASESDFSDVVGAGAIPAAFFDSTTSDYRLRGIKITIRIWDLGTQQVRQVTIIQDM